MISQELLQILACPESRQDLTIADNTVTQKINALIGQGLLYNRAKEKVVKKIDGGLIRQDRKYLYPIRENIPILLIDEAIGLENLPS
jgi:uncharacterized protein YbaR (Trm112 family)